MAGTSNTTVLINAIRDLPVVASMTYSEVLFLPLCLLALSCCVILCKSQADGLPSVNRSFWGEPEVFARMRWGIGAKKILNEAHKIHDDLPYQLSRGDMNITILPADVIPELNLLPPNVINTRNFHSHTLLGHITGIDIVKRTGLHVKILLSRLTPAINKILDPVASRLSAAMTRSLPQDTEKWAVIQPLDLFAQFVSEGVAFILFGSPLCDDPDLVHVCYGHTRSIFTIVFIMRFIPSSLQSTLVWLLPWKWSLTRSWKTIEEIVVPEVHKRREQLEEIDSEDAISWMIRDGETDLERDPKSLSQLVGALLGGSTYSIASLVTGVVSDLIAHPSLLEEVREEIRQKYDEIGGTWDKAAFNSLPKLDSVLKETTRLSPSAILIYSRQMEEDYTMSNGLKLQKGQRVSVNSRVLSMNPSIYENPEIFNSQRHRDGLPFQMVDNNLLTWGSGRWACPGRFLANIMAKVLLVELLHDYELKFIDGKKITMFNIHEFVVYSPYSRISIRRRKDALGFKYGKCM